MVDARAPVAETPLSQKGVSLQPGTLTADLGLISNISQYGRPATAARVLNNFQQLIPGIWTSVGLGWKRQRQAPFNVESSLGTPFREFGVFIDGSGNQTMLFQVFDKLYSYDTVASVETALLTGLNNAPQNTPCLRQSFSPLTGASVVIYTNGDAQPQKITSTSTVTPLAWNATVKSQAPGNPVITHGGAAGTTSYTYRVVANYSNGDAILCAAAVATTTGNAILSATNTNILAWAPSPGAISYGIYRTASSGTPSTTGLIATVTNQTQSTTSPGDCTFTDTGLAGNGVAPVAAGNPAGTIFQSTGTWPNQMQSAPFKTYSAPLFCEPFAANRFIYGGFQSPATAFDVVISSFAGPEDFTQTLGAPLATDAGTFTYPPSLGTLNGLKSLRLSNQTTDTVMIGACSDGVFQITGSDATNYALDIVTAEIGIVSNRTWVQISNDMYFLSTAGYRNFSSLENNAVLTPDEISNYCHDILNEVDPDFAFLAHATHNRATQEVQLWYANSDDNGVVQHGLVMNYNAGTGALKFSTRSGTTVNCAMYWKQQFWGGGPDGLLQMHYQTSLYDGQAMQFNLALSLINIGNISQQSGIRNFQILTEGDSQQFLLTVYKNCKCKNQETGKYGYRRLVAASDRLSDIVTPGTILDDWPLGIGAFPGNYPKILELAVQGSATFWDIEIQSQQSDDALDFVLLQYTLSGGGFQR